MVFMVSLWDIMLKKRREKKERERGKRERKSKKRLKEL